MENRGLRLDTQLQTTPVQAEVCHSITPKAKQKISSLLFATMKAKQRSRKPGNSCCQILSVELHERKHGEWGKYIEWRVGIKPTALSTGQVRRFGDWGQLKHNLTPVCNKKVKKCNKYFIYIILYIYRKGREHRI